jgi:membrane protease YdiL (CAAX protease family)
MLWFLFAALVVDVGHFTVLSNVSLSWLLRIVVCLSRALLLFFVAGDVDQMISCHDASFSFSLLSLFACAVLFNLICSVLFSLVGRRQQSNKQFMISSSSSFSSSSLALFAQLFALPVGEELFYRHVQRGIALNGSVPLIALSIAVSVLWFVANHQPSTWRQSLARATRSCVYAALFAATSHCYAIAAVAHICTNLAAFVVDDRLY